MKWLYMILSFLIVPNLCSANDQSLKVRGRFKVETVKAAPSGSGFEVLFLAEDSQLKPGKLMLHAENIHLAVQPGITFQMVAQVKEKSGVSSEIVQVLLLPTEKVLSSPVWLQSNLYPPTDLKAASYLEMHAPATDFIVM